MSLRIRQLLRRRDIRERRYQLRGDRTQHRREFLPEIQPGCLSPPGQTPGPVEILTTDFYGLRR